MATMTDNRQQKPATEEAEAAPKKKGKRKKLIIILIVVLVLGAGAKFALGGSAKKSSAPVAPKPGPTLALDPVTVNLASGHYLRVGVTVEFTDKVTSSSLPDGSVATDQAITYFTGQDAAPLETAAGLAKAKAGLKDKIAKAYPNDPIYDLLFTSWVVQ